MYTTNQILWTDAWIHELNIWGYQIVWNILTYQRGRPIGRRWTIKIIMGRLCFPRIATERIGTGSDNSAGVRNAIKHHACIASGICPPKRFSFADKTVDFVRLVTMEIMLLLHFLNIWRFIQCTTQTSFPHRPIRSVTTFPKSASYHSPILQNKD